MPAATATLTIAMLEPEVERRPAPHRSPGEDMRLPLRPDREVGVGPVPDVAHHVIFEPTRLPVDVEALLREQAEIAPRWCRRSTRRSSAAGSRPGSWRRSRARSAAASARPRRSRGTGRSPDTSCRVIARRQIDVEIPLLLAQALRPDAIVGRRRGCGCSRGSARADLVLDAVEPQRTVQNAGRARERCTGYASGQEGERAARCVVATFAPLPNVFFASG